MEQVKLVKKNINLMNEFNKLLKDEEFKDYIDKLKIPYEELAKYTSILESMGNSFQTNIPTEEIYDLINMQLDFITGRCNVNDDDYIRLLSCLIECNEPFKSEYYEESVKQLLKEYPNN